MTDTASERRVMAETAGGTASWWDWRLFGLWVLVNGVAFLVIPVVAILLEWLASAATHDLVYDQRTLAVLIIAVVGAATQGVILGRWQWRLLRRRVPELRRGRWVMATLVPAFFVWLAVISPAAVDILARGGDTLAAFGNGIIQALVLGPLIGLSQATALRGHTSRWPWWLAANVATYLSGAGLYEFGSWLQQALSLPGRIPAFFPVVAIAIHGAFMLWVTAPAATADASPALQETDAEPEPAIAMAQSGEEHGET
jgi:Na+/citrate or Na+/malate symporter